MKTPTVSVVIATFNSSATLKIAIQSVLFQDYTDFEVWVVGDCCTDNSQQVVKSFDDHRLNWVNLAHNSGSQSIPNNEGVRLAKGKYIAFLGHDDLWFPNHLRTLIEALEHQNADFAYCLTVMLGSDGNHFVSGLKKDFSERAFLLYQAHIPPSSWLFKKEIAAHCGPWLPHSASVLPVDVEYLRRIVREGKKVTFVDGLFIVKFPSAMWKMYAKTVNFPQEYYFGLIKSDTQGASIMILMELAHSFSQKYNALYTVQKSLKTLIKSLFYSFIDFYSSQRFPMNVFLLYKNNYQRKRARLRRGLSAKNSRSRSRLSE